MQARWSTRRSAQARTRCTARRSSRSDQAAVYRNALKAAYADARARAQALAEAAGVTLGAMTSTVEGGASTPMPLAAGRAEDAKATIEPGTQEIQASVSVTFAVS